MEGSLGEYLSFRRMITPVFIQVIFWIIAGFAILGGLAALVGGEALSGLLLIVLGPLFARIYAEILIVIFRINDNVSRIAARGSQAAPAPAYAAPEPPPASAAPPPATP